MTTLFAITRHELRRALRDRALPWLLVLFAALAAYGAWNGAHWAKGRAATVQLITEEIGPLVEMRREQLAEAPAGTWPFSATPQLAPFRLVLSPGAMAPLSIGQAEAYPYAARMIPLQDITMFDAFKVDVDNPAVRAAGRFDLALAAANVLSPAPSEMRFSAAYLEQSRAIRKEQRQVREARGPEVIADPAPKIPDRIRNFFKERTVEDQRLAPLVQSQLNARAERRAVLDTLRLFLPSVAAQDALDRIAGADADRAVSFQTQAMAFTAQTKVWLGERLKNDQPLASEDYDRLPRFLFREAPAGAFQTGVLADLGALAFAIALLVAGAVLGRRAAASL